jgi:hypothetical protein
MGYKARGLVIDMSGMAGTSVYISAANKVSLTDVECFGGKEGVGIYNNARHVKHSACDSHDHTQDGFVVIAGQRVDYAGCMGYGNGQSGFTTQRQGGGTDVQRISYNGCHAYQNVFDGFDIRGATTTPWSVDMYVTLQGCVSTDNGGTGYYIVNAEGTTLVGCQAVGNQQQNFFANTSHRVQFIGCRSSSGANAVATGTNKAGFIVFNSNSVALTGCISSNESGATQNYGASFTGSSVNGTITGGY